MRTYAFLMRSLRVLQAFFLGTQSPIYCVDICFKRGVEKKDFSFDEEYNDDEWISCLLMSLFQLFTLHLAFFTTKFDEKTRPN